jgi:3alpha(or 20beta)-hydroxysteroid dehydrogenase
MGAAEARLFVEHGAKVMIADVLDAEGEVLAKELGPAARYIHLDVTDEDAWAACVDDTVQAFGPLDILVNNAGVASLSPIVNTTTEEYLRVVGVNQLGVFLGIAHRDPGDDHRWPGVDRQRLLDRRHRGHRDGDLVFGE